MKTFYFVLLALWLGSTGNLYAQSGDPLRQKLDQVFGTIDKTQIPYGHLEDYATPLIPLDPFNGTLTS